MRALTRVELRDGWMHPLLLDLRGAAELLAVTPQTARTWTVAGRVPGIRVGGSWRFWRPALLAAVVGPDQGRGQAEDDQDPQLVSIPELADLLGIHARTVNLLLRQGSLPGRKIGGRWRVYWPAVRDAIATGRPLAPPGPESPEEATSP